MDFSRRAFSGLGACPGRAGGSLRTRLSVSGAIASPRTSNGSRIVAVTETLGASVAVVSGPSQVLSHDSVAMS